MTNSNRVLLNTVSQYTRTVLNVLLTLYSTRIILSSLGATDYGLYSLIAGVVAMLSFVSNALVISTQRYLSFYHGRKDKTQLSSFFGNSLLIHFALSILLLIILLSLTSLIVYSFLDIPEGRENAASKVYMIVAGMISLTFVTSPFRALYVARENIVYISVVDVLDGVLKVVAAILLTYVLYDRLVMYAVFLFCITSFNLIAFASYALVRYEECHLPRIGELDRTYLKQLLEFASWTLYSTGCVVARTQGLAVVINKYFGVVLNASYGIAQQVNGAIANASQAIANALSPQIVKAEGEGNRNKMLRLAGLESKYALIMLTVVSMPVLFELPLILELWLGNIPDQATMFSRFVMIACMCDQVTAGLGIANQAIGKIKNYSILFGTVKILTIPASIIAIYITNNPFFAMLSFVVMEILTTLLRLIFLHKTAGLHILSFVKQYVLPSLCVVLSSALICFVVNAVCHWTFRILLMYVLSIVGILVATYITMDSEEKNVVRTIISRKRK